MDQTMGAGASPENPALGVVRRTSRWVLLCTLLVSAGMNILLLTSPLYMMQIYDRVLSTRHPDTLIFLTVAAVGALLALALLDFSRSLVGQRLGAWIERSLAGEVVAATVRVAHLAGAGRTVQGLRDLASVRGLFAGGGLWPLLDVPWMPIFFFAIYLIHPLLFWCSVLGGLVLLILTLGNELLTRRPTQQASAYAMQATAEADAAVRNADAMTAMGILPNFVARWSRAYDAGGALQLVAGQRSAALASFAKFVRFTLQMAILGVGAFLVIRGEITGGVMIAASILMARAVAPLEQAIGGWRGIVGAQLAYKRLTRLLEDSPRITESIRLPRPTGEVMVERVAYAVPALRDPVLRGITCRMPAGECIGIIGPSGAGKTTLLRVIVGSLVPQSGVARLDGVAVQQMAAADKNLYVGYLPQDVELFNGTVRENIARFTETSDTDVVLAAKLAGAHETILRLPQGYNTVIGPNGISLSGGQRQRVGLARALFGEPRLVVLDEPNANLDSDGEQALVKALQRLRECRVTTILVTQRMSLLSVMDKVLMLRQGSVENYAPASEVIKEMMRSAAAAKADAPAAAAAAAAPVGDQRRANVWVMPGTRMPADEHVRRTQEVPGT